MASKTYKARVRIAKNDQTYWNITAPNNRKVATAGEQFFSEANARRSFLSLMDELRNMPEEQWREFLEGFKTATPIRTRA